MIPLPVAAAPPGGVAIAAAILVTIEPERARRPITFVRVPGAPRLRQQVWFAVVAEQIPRHLDAARYMARIGAQPAEGLSPAERPVRTDLPRRVAAIRFAASGKTGTHGRGSLAEIRPMR
ncbi:MAG: hypothetical protein U1E76_21155 [Planctomycetota bacterium]